MKKQILTFLFIGACAVTFGQQTPAQETKLEPWVYASQEELESSAPERIQYLKSALEQEGLTEEAKKGLSEMLWRFENAIVVKPEETEEK